MDLPAHLVVMGVSGSGKSAVGQLLATRWGRVFLDADDLHPAQNVATLRAGIALTDGDRAPWLAAVRDWMTDQTARGQGTVVACSALQRSARDLLRSARGDVAFVHLDPDPALVQGRLARRTGHFMPVVLLGSQYATLEPLAADEPGVVIDSGRPVLDVVDEVVRRFATAGEAAGDRRAAMGGQRDLRLGQRTFGPHELVVMAIVNRTPDSFYDQGATFAEHAAVAAAERALDAGAGIIDIGGVKAGVGPEVSPAEEIDRVAGVIAALRSRRPEAVISVDTWRAEVGRAAVAAGADLLNDPWQGHDPELARVAADTGAGLVCSHSGHLPPRTDPDNPRYDDVVTDVIHTVTALAERAVGLGARPDGILIDPAHDFGKSTLHSLEITRRMGELVATGWPVLVAMSNKDFVGETLGLPVDQRLPGTLAATAVTAWAGARFFRAHNVAETRQVLDMVSSIQGTRPPTSSRR